MSTLTYTNETLAPAASETEKTARKPLWRRALNAMIEAQQRRADREIARLLQSHGGLTDELEREIMRRINGRRIV